MATNIDDQDSTRIDVDRRAPSLGLSGEVGEGVFICKLKVTARSPTRCQFNKLPGAAIRVSPDALLGELMNRYSA
jgi:hypothetical protein